MVINGNSRIAGVGIFLPDERISSISLMEEIQAEKRFGIPLNWVDRRIGIVERRFAACTAEPSDLATEASRTALAKAGVDPRHLDMIIYCGIEKDYMEPSTAHIIQKKLESDAVCMDVSNACQGVVSGMTVADALISNGSIETALICSGERASKVVKQFIHKINTQPDEYFRDRFGVMTVGDAGSAVVLTRGEKTTSSGIKAMHFDSRGEYADFCFYRYGEDGIEGQMLMKGITDTINAVHTEMMPTTYDDLDWQPEDVDYMICHQVGKKSVTDLCEISRIPLEKTPLTYIYLGNTASCSIPIALDYANAKEGDKILMMGGGSGLASFQGGVVW
jgi:3-oxoacyl-(acyl-carrier-protein) synthase III